MTVERLLYSQGFRELGEVEASGEAKPTIIQESGNAENKNPLGPHAVVRI
jgi:hypothetical protein